MESAATSPPGSPARPASTANPGDDYDLALIVALKEEFRWLESALKMEPLSPIDGEYYFHGHLGSYRVLVHQIGDMGAVLASLAVTKLLNEFQIKTIILLGIAGGLDDDVSIGDVIVANEIDHYLHAAKIVDSDAADGKWELKFSGLAFPTAMKFRKLTTNFEAYNKAAFQQWQSAARAMLEDDELPNPGTSALPCRPEPELHLGSIASGELVVATSEFARQLKSRDRKYLAVEMEAGGVALAAHAHHSAIPLLVVRGVSDMADVEKKQLEDGDAHWPPKFWRRYSFLNAFEWVRQLAMCTDFQELIPPSHAPIAEEVEAPDSELDLNSIEVSELNFNYELTKAKELNDLTQQVKTSSKEEASSERKVLSETLDTELQQAFEEYVSNRLRAAPKRQVFEKILLEGANIKLDIEESTAIQMLDDMIERRLALREFPYIIRPPDLDWSAT